MSKNTFYYKEVYPINKNKDKLNGIYQEIAEECGFEVALKLFENYRGLQVTFPNKFVDSQYIHSKIIAEYSKGVSIQELVKKYKYSERYIRMILKNFKEGVK